MKSYTIKELTKMITDFSAARDWEQFHRPIQLALSVNLEVSEVLEKFQWLSDEEFSKKIKNKKFKEEFADELADVLAYLLELANATDIDLSQAYVAKLKKAANKYPVKKSKGNHKKYTELK